MSNKITPNDWLSASSEALPEDLVNRTCLDHSSDGFIDFQQRTPPGRMTHPTTGPTEVERIRELQISTELQLLTTPGRMTHPTTGPTEAERTQE